MGNCLRLGISKIGLAWTKRKIRTSIKLKSISILILGTQKVGKTTIALRLWKYKRTLPDLNYVQTKGFNTYAIKRKNKGTINLYDLGGHPSIQELWDHYYADAHGVIFVVDVSDQASLADAAVLFAKVLHDERIRGKPILLLANKQDLGGASEVELDSVMNLQEVVNTARCLTRLDESTSIDLKNDKGIFDGFRWLISHIENHYHELNDRVMHDILQEKNREKTRRAELKEQMEETTELNCNDNRIPLPNNQGPHCQKSLPSCTFTRDTVDLQQPNIPLTPQNNVEPRKDSITSNDITNYLIKSRPNSSIGDANNPFVVHRNVATAPIPGRRISLPSLPSFMGRGKVTSSSLFTTHNTNGNSNSTTQSAAKGPMFSRMLSESRRDSEKALLVSAPVSSSSGYSATSGGMVTERLSPEGADSDEGIVNPAFDATEESDKPEESWGSDVLSAQNVHVIPSVADVSPKIATPPKRPLSSPETLKRLDRTESSDTERAGEILMVTTLVQVHQDQRQQISKDRRGSTTSTHDSVALSLSSFKSEDAIIVDEDLNVTSQTQSTNKATPQLQTHIPPTPNMFKVSEHSDKAGLPSIPSIASIEKDKSNKKRNLRSGMLKNKTAPLPPGMVSASSNKSHSQPPADIFTSGNVNGNKVSGIPLANRNSTSLSNRKSRESSTINNATVGGFEVKKRIKKSFNGFSEPGKVNSGSGSQFTTEISHAERKVTTTCSPMTDESSKSTSKSLSTSSLNTNVIE